MHTLVGACGAAGVGLPRGPGRRGLGAGRAAGRRARAAVAAGARRRRAAAAPRGGRRGPRGLLLRAAPRRAYVRSIQEPWGSPRDSTGSAVFFPTSQPDVNREL